MPATAAQVFGPTTVDPGFTTTGEKTLLNMSTTLPAGGKNVIIVTMGKTSSVDSVAQGTYRIYKGATLLYESKISGEYFNYLRTRATPVLLIAVDTSPAGNDTYVFKINITTADTSSGSVHVQGIVIKTSDAVWGYNTTGVSIASGETATVTSISTNYPANSKVALVAMAHASVTPNYTALISGGNIKLKSGATIVSSNQFSVGAYGESYPLWVSLAYLDSPTSSTQTYSLEVTNNSGYTLTFYAEIVAFTVSSGSFLDTGSVALTNGSQVTVGNLSTTLTGDVVVIGLAAVENTRTSNVTAFNAGDVVLQKDNSTTGQISNLVGWVLYSTSGYYGRSGILPLFRLDTAVTNPSYQIKMTARANGINGEAKILAFSLVAGVDIKKVFGETLRLLENIILRRGRFRRIAEQINLLENIVLSRMWLRVRGETINLVDAFQRSANKFRQALEGLNIFESSWLIRGRILQISEMVRISEIVARVRQMFREVVEDINLNEVILISRGVVRVFGEFVNLLENVVRSRIINKVVSETERLVESFVSVLGKVVGVIESVRILESTLLSRMWVRISNELVRVSEVFSKHISMVKTITEQVRLLETFKVLSSKFRAIAESVSIGEAFNSFRGAVMQVVEIVNISEVSSRLSNLFRSVVESVRIGEFVMGVRNMFIRVLEGVNVIESITSSRFLARVRNELIEVGELFSGFIGRVEVVVENVRIIEAFLLSVFKTYIKRLKSVLRGMTRSNLMGSSKGGEP